MDIATVTTELLAGHPDTGAYDADDAVAADELNAVNRPGPIAINALTQYVVLEVKDDETLLGRVKAVAGSVAGDIPYSVVLTRAHITACQSAVAALQPGATTTVASGDARLTALISNIAGSGAIDSAHAAAIQALGANSQSRASELGMPRVRTAHVTKARA